MPGEEKNGTDLVRVARLSPQTFLTAAIVVGGVLGGAHVNSKHDATDAKIEQVLESSRETRVSVDRLSTSLTELRAKVEASEKLALDTRLRTLEQLGTERRLEALERELADGKGRK